MSSVWSVENCLASQDTGLLTVVFLCYGEVFLMRGLLARMSGLTVRRAAPA